MATELIIGVGSGVGGIAVGGYLVRFLFQRIFDRINGDHDKIIRMEVELERAQKDLDALHEKIRELQRSES